MHELARWLTACQGNFQHRKEVDPENGSTVCGVVVLSGLHKNPRHGYDKRVVSASRFQVGGLTMDVSMQSSLQYWELKPTDCC